MAINYNITMDDDFGESSSSAPSSSLLTCTFNQDGGCLAVGTTSGFSVHNIHPQYSLSVDRLLRGGIGRVEMLFRCNLMALVGGGPTPHSAPHRVLIWDDHLPKEIGELSFRQAVLQVKLRKDAVSRSKHYNLGVQSEERVHYAIPHFFFFLSFVINFRFRLRLRYEIEFTSII